MYLPKYNKVDDEVEIRRFVAAVGSATIITVGPDGAPDATLLPILWEGSQVQTHLALANRHWRRITDGAPGLAVVSGPDVYVSPSWYATKAEHGKVVPTWNYSSVHLSGSVTVIRDESWLRDQVERLTRTHETGRSGWEVSDAPSAYVDGLIKAIVGIEMLVERVEAKAKLSQNRSEDDKAGVIAGLESEAHTAGMAVADAMRNGRIA